MNHKVQKLLEDKGGNYIFPFFWQHGEEEDVLREYMKVIEESNIKAVCIESRPHPDFCGPGWWHDMDIILEEAKKRGMKVWILDDSHFPTGFANGAVEKADASLSRQSIVHQVLECMEPGTEMKILIQQYRKATSWQPNQIEQFIMRDGVPEVEGDEILCIAAIKEGGQTGEDIIDLTEQAEEENLTFIVPDDGIWKIHICHSTRNRGTHRNYINMLNYESCRIQLDAVYEPHYMHYKEEFGTTIAGFFSDEPELGNGHMFEMGKHLSEMDDLPWSQELMEALKVKWGSNYHGYLSLLWKNNFVDDTAAKVRFDYIDTVTRLIQKDFSIQMVDWCHAHGVEYIGHVIEDNNQHARTGTSLGHYFRGLYGQDMSGIDDIGGQVYPQGEKIEPGMFGNERDGEFYHYVLGKLGSSAAAIEPWKKGRAMCEIFGAYGWAEGVRLEKYLIDHFLVRGINQYVPHAFSPKEFPDPDCPPHFYAHGHNPQYRHFGKLMKYVNRVCELMNDGHHIAPAAILYMGEAEWTGDFMHMQKPAMQLADQQIDYDIIPADVFEDMEKYHAEIINTLKINQQEYKVFIVPETRYLSAAAAEGIRRMIEKSMPVIFINRLPEKICNDGSMLPFDTTKCKVAALDRLVEELKQMEIEEVRIQPENNRIRYRHYDNNSDLYMFINEGTEKYCGKITVPQTGNAYVYNAWENVLESADMKSSANGTELTVEMEPLKSLIVLFDNASLELKAPLKADGEQKNWSDRWKRSICESKAYPQFEQDKEVNLPDTLERELPKFSGFVRYEKILEVEKVPAQMILEITDAYEGVEVFVNGISAGIQIIPTYLYNIAPLLNPGENQIRIEVATTLERAMSDETDYLKMMGQSQDAVPTCPSGINGVVRLIV